MTRVFRRRGLRYAAAVVLVGAPQPAFAADQTAVITELQQQIDKLRKQVEALIAAQAAETGARASNPVPARIPMLADSQAPAASEATTSAPVVRDASASKAAEALRPKKAWYEKLQLRGYTQLRTNELISSDEDAAPGASRLRSVHDGGVGEDGNFSFRRVRLVVQGDVSERLSLYLQTDLAGAVNGQSNGERREHFAQLRDAYADLHFANHTLKVRAGQSKVPFGWENMQSSSNRLTLDRADAANSAVPGERDLGMVVYYTPEHVQTIWDELSAEGQKLFGNYGAFGFGVFNGQGINRSEKNDGLMKVALATWPFRLDGLGAPLRGQVLELGLQGLLNKVQPEVRGGGVSPIAFDEKRMNLHAVLYPNPIGLQAEWTWGTGPQWDPTRKAIENKNLSGGYVQAMYRVSRSPIGVLMPYARWQRYRGGWKASTNAPRLATDELELGIEWQPLKELELTVAYTNMRRSEADERRIGRAEGDLIRTQLQWNY